MASIGVNANFDVTVADSQRLKRPRPGHQPDDMDRSVRSVRSFSFVQQQQKASRRPRIRRSQIDGYTNNFKLTGAGNSPKSAIAEATAEATVETTLFHLTPTSACWDGSFESVVPDDTYRSSLIPDADSEVDDLEESTEFTLSAMDPDGLAVVTSYGEIPSFVAPTLDCTLHPDFLAADIELIAEDTILGNDHHPFHFPLTSGVQYTSPAEQASVILDMYDREFCVLPLTMDCQSNPFRIRKESCEGSAFLLHAVMAISAQHLAKKNGDMFLATEAQNHQGTAMKLFSQALSRTSAIHLLDTLLIMFNYEATQTASSAWDVHLNGASKLLEVMSVARVCSISPRTRAQIAMLIWWDVTIACLSRRETRLPLAYLETLSGYAQDDGWTFYALNGCPLELVMYMVRLAKLASIYETVVDLEHTTFDHRTVATIVDEVRNWRNPEEFTFEDLEASTYDTNAKQNGFHCLEAWRYGILLYCYRVFDRPPGPERLRSISHLARLVTDHIKCIPPTEIVQKQTLLPLFLAAAEASSEVDRDFARQYCVHWSATARYHMFTTVMALLEQIWEASDLSPARHTFWWGIKVMHTRTTNAPSSQSLRSEHLLG